MHSAVAERYAKALADVILASGSDADARQALTELRAFEAMVKSSTDLRNVLMSPAVSPSRKRAVVSRFSPIVPLSPLVRNFLFVVLDRRRADLL
jgi:F-type H+-transporting ATPase subunit delta